jgi:hypothetical protein
MLFKDTKFTHIPSCLNILHVEDADFGSVSYLYVIFGSIPLLPYMRLSVLFINLGKRRSMTFKSMNLIQITKHLLYMHGLISMVNGEALK